MTSNPTPDRRAEISAHLWQIAEQHIVAEWICCEPLEPRHDLCAKGYAALGMAKTLLVDSDPEKAWNPAAPVLDAVMQLLPAAPAVSSVVGQTTRDRIADVAKPFFMNFSDEEAAKVNAGELAAALAAVLPPPVSRADVYRDAADALERKFEGATRATIELRRLADEAQQSAVGARQPDTEAEVKRLRAELAEEVRKHNNTIAVAAGRTVDAEEARAENARLRAELERSRAAAVLLWAAEALERTFEGITPATVELRLMAAKAQQHDTETPGYDYRAWETYRRDAGCGCTDPNPVDCAIPHGTGAWLCVCHRLSGPPIKESDPPGTPTAASSVVPGRSAATDTHKETQPDPNTGPGWYEVINPRNATTNIALVHEDGSLYLPEGEKTLTADEFTFAAARGNAHRLVRADDQEPRP